MTAAEIEARIVEIIERAEYAGRQDMLAIKTTGNKIARNAREGADISSKMARQMAAMLAIELGQPDLSDDDQRWAAEGWLQEAQS